MRHKDPSIHTYFSQRLIAPAQALPLAAHSPVYRHVTYRHVRFPTLYYTIENTTRHLPLNIRAGKQRGPISGQTFDEHFSHI